MKLLILGANGMLGHDLGRVFLDSKPVCWDKNYLDITDKKLVFQKIGDLKPDIVINAAAYTDVDGCETNQKLAMKVNGCAVGYLASICQKIGAVFLHYSTDYVFDGKNPRGYREDDAPQNPVNVYGESKLLGEKFLRELGIKNCESGIYLIRTSWLFGKNGKNFVDTMLKLGKEKDEIKVVNNQHGKPTYTLDLAKRTRNLLLGEVFQKDTVARPSGLALFRSRQPSRLRRHHAWLPPRGFFQDFSEQIFHITNENETTWYDFACEIFKQAKELGILEKIPKVIPCASQEFPRLAKRPSRSSLISTKLPAMRSWKEALTDYLKEVKIYR